MQTPPFATTSSPLKDRVEGEFVRRLKQVPFLARNYRKGPNSGGIGPQYLNEPAPAPKITCVASPGPEYTVGTGIFRVPLTIEARLPDPPPTTEGDNAKLLEATGGAIRDVLNAAQAEGVFGVTFGQEYERKGENWRARVFNVTILTA